MPYADKELQRAYMRRWIANRRAEFFSGKSCIGCGSSLNLELHHLDRTKKVDHRIWSWSKARREAEIAKCVVLCDNCHQAETSKQLRNPPIIHGGMRGYRRGCRCDACVATMLECSRRWRMNARQRQRVNGQGAN